MAHIFRLPVPCSHIRSNTVVILLIRHWSCYRSKYNDYIIYRAYFCSSYITVHYLLPVSIMFQCPDVHEPVYRVCARLVFDLLSILISNKLSYLCDIRIFNFN